jgi:hypothetical protein
LLLLLLLLLLLPLPPLLLLLLPLPLLLLLLLLLPPLLLLLLQLRLLTRWVQQMRRYVDTKRDPNAKVANATHLNRIQYPTSQSSSSPSSSSSSGQSPPLERTQILCIHDRRHLLQPSRLRIQSVAVGGVCRRCHRVLLVLGFQI